MCECLVPPAHPVPASAPPGCGRFTVKTPHTCHNPTGGCCTQAPPQLPASSPEDCSAPPTPTPLASWPSSCCGHCQGPGPRALCIAVIFVFNFQGKSSLSHFSSLSARRGPPRLVGWECMFTCLVPVCWPARQKKGPSGGSFSAKQGAGRGSAPHPRTRGCRTGRVLPPGCPGVQRPGQGFAVATSGVGTPELRAFGANTSANPCVQAAAGEAAGCAGCLAGASHAHTCSPPARAHLCVLCPWAWRLVVLGQVGVSARPKWLQAGFQRLPRQHATLSWTLGINWAPISSSGPTGPDPAGRC